MEDRERAAGRPTAGTEPLAGDSYRRLTDVLHAVLSEHDPERLWDLVANELTGIIPYDALTIYRADPAAGLLTPILARDPGNVEAIMATRGRFGEGLTGWAAEQQEPVLANEAHRDPRGELIEGTDREPEAVLAVPLLAGGTIKGVLTVYRIGDRSAFSHEEFQLAQRFADLAAIALQNAEARTLLEHQAQTDWLTGAYNHRYFHERLRSELTRASRSQDAVGLLMFDIDDFKRVNDAYGHAVGDHVLIRIVQTLRPTLRASDVMCRLGGEEFGVIMPSCDAGDALGLASRIADTLAAAELVPGETVTVSVGVAQGPVHAVTPRDLTACAEKAMIAAKTRGKNRIVLYDPNEADAAAGLRTEIRSLAHLKMLQSLAGKLTRMTSVREIGETIAGELRTLIDYHNCRVYSVDGSVCQPIAVKGEWATAQESDEHVAPPVLMVGEGITGQVAATGKPALIPNALTDESSVPVAGTEEVDESLLVVPMKFSDRVIGVIVVSKLGIDQFDGDDLKLLEMLAAHASVALENARTYEAQKREAEIAIALLEFGRALAESDSVGDVFSKIVERAASILRSPRTSVWMQDPVTGDLVAEAQWGHEGEEQVALLDRRYPAEYVTDWLDRTQPFVMSARDFDQIEWLTDPLPEVCYAIAPLRLDTGRLGCLVAAAALPGENRFADKDLRLLEGMALQARLAINNLITYETLESTFISTIEALANALEAKDEYTSSHARSITDMALELGDAMGMDEKALKRLELGALFHDIGKIGIPSAILLKPGPLTPEEFEVMKGHPELGERILAPIAQLQDVRPIIRSCHERFDGRGYPDGKAGDEIPLEARIIFVCDAFDAMTTNRPYRAALTSEEAISRLEKGAGTQFDPNVVKLFLEMVTAAL